MPEVISNTGGTQGIITTSNDSKKDLKEGDSINLRLSLWPKDIFLTNKIEDLEGKIFLKFFYILKINRIEISRNNNDVVNIYFKSVILRPFIKTPFYIWSVGKRNIPIEIRGLKASPLNGKKGDFYFGTLKLKEDNKKELKLIVTVIIFVSLVSLLLTRKFLRNISIRRKGQDDSTYWIKKFIGANDRLDYECIYKQRKEWGMVFDRVEKEKKDFFNILNECQYRPYWTEEMRLEVSKSFSKIIEKIRK